MNKKPTLGRIVHYVLNNGPSAGKHRPAVVVEVTNEYTVNLQVFSDGTKGTMPHGDGLPNVFRKVGALLDDNGHTQGTWHYPEEE
jgi:hypothetical protein